MREPLIEHIAKALVDAPLKFSSTSYETATKPSSNSKLPRPISASDWKFRPRRPRLARRAGARQDRNRTSATRWRSSNSGTGAERRGEFITLAWVVKNPGTPAQKSQSNCTPIFRTAFAKASVVALAKEASVAKFK